PDVGRTITIVDGVADTCASDIVGTCRKAMENAPVILTYLWAGPAHWTLTVKSRSVRDHGGSPTCSVVLKAITRRTQKGGAPPNGEPREALNVFSNFQKSSSSSSLTAYGSEGWNSLSSALAFYH